MARETRLPQKLIGAAGAIAALAALGTLLTELLARAEPGMLPAPVQTMTGRRARLWAGFYDDWHGTSVPDRALGFRHLPNLDVVLAGHPDFSYRLRTNSRGLRTPVEDGPVDVVALGDSFTFGYGVDEKVTWPSQLARLSGLTVANLGISGYGPGSELAMLRQEGLRLQPRLVLWQFFANDLLDATSFAAWQAAGRGDFLDWERARTLPPAAPGLPAPGVSLRGLLHRHLVSYELAKWASRQGVYDPGRRPARWIDVDGAPLLLDIGGPAAWSDRTNPWVRDEMALTAAALEAARDDVRAMGAELIVVLAPTKEAVYWQGEARERIALEGNDRWAAQVCRVLGIPCLPLLPVFASAAQQSGPLYFREDVHWNPAGHRLAGREIARFTGENLS